MTTSSRMRLIQCQYAILQSIANRDTASTVRMLRELGSFQSVTSDHGDGPLHWAASAGHTDLVVWLLRQGANPDMGDAKQVTPLKMAAICDHHSTVSALLSAGANPNLCDSSGFAPLHCAAFQGTACTSLLLLVGADPNIAARDGSTPLHVVGSTSAAKLLLEYGANPLIRDAEGLSPSGRAFLDERGVVGEFLDSSVPAGDRSGVGTLQAFLTVRGDSVPELSFMTEQLSEDDLPAELLQVTTLPKLQWAGCAYGPLGDSLESKVRMLLHYLEPSDRRAGRLMRCFYIEYFLHPRAERTPSTELPSDLCQELESSGIMVTAHPNPA